MINKQIVRNMLLEEYDRKDSYKKVLQVLKSVKTKEQYNNAVSYANNYIKISGTNLNNKDWKDIDRMLTFLKIKIKLNR